MFHVVYKWFVPSKNKSAFLKSWEQTTNHIHETVDGALGSFCIEAVDDTNTLMTIARWHSREQWEAFIGTAKTGPMRKMHTFAKQISVDGYYELGDHTKPTDT